MASNPRSTAASATSLASSSSSSTLSLTAALPSSSSTGPSAVSGGHLLHRRLPLGSSSGLVGPHQGGVRAMPGCEGFANASARHPLDPLDTRELREAGVLAGRALSDAGLEALGAVRLSEVALQEPDKGLVLRYTGQDRQDAAAQGLPREARVLCYGAESGRAYLVLVNLSAQRATRVQALPPMQPRFGPDDYETCEEVVRAHAGFQRAMRQAGYDPNRVMIDPWSMGYFGPEDDPSRRLCWALMYYKEKEEDNTYARPVEGLRIVIDLLNKEVVRFEVVPGYEGGVRVAAPDEPRYMNYTPSHLHRQDLKDLVIVQPDGPSFSLRGRQLTWQGWSLRVGFTAQEGLVLHMLSFTDRHKSPALGPVVRPVLYRLSFAEMVVPYGDPAFPHYKKNAFDGGEDGLGTNAHSLSLGCDCLGHIHYLDADLGPLRPGQEACVIPQAICIHEEDGGVLWKHKDWRTDTAEVRRQRRLVLSFMCTIGNYDYGFYYHLSLDGSIEMEVRLTGILSVGNLEPRDMSEERGGHRPFGTTLHLHSSDPQGGPGGLFAPHHQHIFCARMDMAVDGPRNRLVEVDSHKLPIGDPENPHASAWAPQETLLTSERKAMRDADLHKERFWLIQSDSQTNRTGKRTAYKLVAKDPITVMAHPHAAFLRRAGFACHTVWGTAYHPEERFPAGDYPNQDPTLMAGLPSWVLQDRPLVDRDLVVWHVFGAHHIPRLEDWPLMPAERVSCMLKPFGFFDASPVMDVAPSSRRQLLTSTSNNTSRHTTASSGGGQQQVEPYVVKPAEGSGDKEDCCNGPRGPATTSSSGHQAPPSGGSKGGVEALVLKARL